jgi:heat-inducible transcriptional repressor
MPAQRLTSRQRRTIDERLRAAPPDTDRLTTVASQLLSELSDQVGVVLTPAMGETVLRAVDFVPLAGQRALCVVVADGGAVESKVIDTPEPLSREEMVRISNYLSENFAGLTLVEVRARLLQRMADERAQMDRLLSLAIALASQGIGAGPGREATREVVVDGTWSLLASPEVADVARLRRLLDAFNDKARLVQLLNRCLAGQGMRVFIGEDSDLTSELDLSLVATTYGGGGRPSGSLGIVGPPRMAYPRIVPLVHYLGRALSQALAPLERS